MKFLFASILVFSFSITSNAKTIQIKMMNVGKEGPMVFVPAYVKASVGDTIEFLPTDPGHVSSSIFVPKGAGSWVGKLNKKVSTTIKKEGVYLYECQPHSAMGMVGLIQVGKPTNLKAAKDFAAKYKAKIMLNKNRLDKYLGQVK